VVVVFESLGAVLYLAQFRRVSVKMESNLRFQSWFDAEIEWTRSLRRRKLMVFLKCIGITVIVALLVGLVGYFMDAIQIVTQA